MDGEVIINTSLKTSMVDKQIALLENKLEGLVEEYEILEKAEPFEGQTEALIKLGNEIDRTKSKLNKLKNSQKQDFGDIGKELDKTVKKVGKWGLAVFGIRSAYNFVKSSISTLAGQNDEMTKKLEIIRNALAQTIAPIVEKIINLAYSLVQVIGKIIKSISGRDIFASTNKSINKSVKSAKQLKQQLSGVDELNVVSSNKGNTGGTKDNSEVPTGFKWILDNGGTVLGIIGGIIAGMAAFKIESALAGAGIIEKASIIQSLGIGVLIAGIVLLIQDIVDMIQDSSWENFVAILGDIAIVIGGIMLLLGSWWGILIAGIGLLVKLVAENWDAIKEILGKVGTWIYEHIIKPIGEFFSGLWEGIKESFGKAFNWIKDKFKSLVDFFKSLIKKIVDVFKTIGTKVGDAISGAFKAVINGVLSAIENILNFPIKSINKLIDVINAIPGIDIKKLDTFKLPRLAKGGILNMPGRGVPVGGAIVGERGMEGVLPLTDTAQMELLGQTIGKYISLNATIPVYVGNRQIAREIRQINANEQFASNL